MKSRLGARKTAPRSEISAEDEKGEELSNAWTASPPSIARDVTAARAAVAASDGDVREAIFHQQATFIRSLGFQPHFQELIYVPSSIELAERLSIPLALLRGSDETVRTLSIKLTEEGLLRDGYCPSWFSESFDCSTCGTVPNRPLYAQGGICPWCERRAKMKSALS